MKSVSNKQRPARILLVEDNRGDVILTSRAFKESKIANELTAVSSGEEALAFLQKEGDYKNQELPDLILLDLNLPKISGAEVLEKVKNTPALKRIPVIVLSSSHAETDVTKCYDLHANAYIVKPINLENFYTAVQKVEQFWFTLVLSPEFTNE